MIQRPTVQANINSEEFKNLVIPAPPLKKQNEIIDHIHQLRKQAKQLKKEAKQEIENDRQKVEEILLTD